MTIFLEQYTISVHCGFSRGVQWGLWGGGGVIMNNDFTPKPSQGGIWIFFQGLDHGCSPKLCHMCWVHGGHNFDCGRQIQFRSSRRWRNLLHQVQVWAVARLSLQRHAFHLALFSSATWWIMCSPSFSRFWNTPPQLLQSAAASSYLLVLIQRAFMPSQLSFFQTTQ